MAAVTLGLGARNLRDTDYFSKSDPFVVVSRPNLAGGFQTIRTSETKNNTLNPDWKDFYFTVDEICNGDTTLNIKFEVYDDDGKKGLDSKDKLIGQGFFSLKHLESAFNVHSNLPITDGKNKQKNKGALVVRTFRYHNMNSPHNNGVGHVPSSGGSGYHQSVGESGRPPYNQYAGESGRPPYQQPGGGSGYHQSADVYPSARPPIGEYSSARPPIEGYPLGQAMNMVGPGMPNYPPQQQPPYGGAPGGGYGGAPGYPGAPGGLGGAPGYPGAPGGMGGAPGYPNAPGGGYPGSAYPGGQNVGGGGLFPDSQLPPGPGYR